MRRGRSSPHFSDKALQNAQKMGMNTVKIKAYAKVNLTLEIEGMENGYHLLDSLVASIDIFDLLVLKKRKGRLSAVTMHGMGSESIPPERNNALKAAEEFSAEFGTAGGADHAQAFGGIDQFLVTLEQMVVTRGLLHKHAVALAVEIG